MICERDYPRASIHTVYVYATQMHACLLRAASYHQILQPPKIYGDEI